MWVKTRSMKYSFYNDYAEGVHPKVLEALQASNLSQETGYGEDSFTKAAAELIRGAIGNPGADVHFVSGGTQANLIVLSSMLRSFESVIAVESGHINVHEGGALEATGHKINTVPGVHGKLVPRAIEEVCTRHDNEQMVMPRAVYISNSTELGTVYTKEELRALSRTCKNLGLYFYLDGARLGSALTSKDSDITLAELSSFVDVFYIGGTKNGALLGEAIVINNPDLQKDFRYHLKQRGALLAKGRAISLQFRALFTDDLYFELARHANRMAALLANAITTSGYTFLTPPSTNQLFPILPNTVIESLQEDYGFYVWEKGENTSSIRLVTSWATSEEAVKVFITKLKNS